MPAQGQNQGEIGYVEEFALSADRAAALKQLIPGTEDFYYYHSLHLQNTEQFAKVEELLKPWIERHGQTARVREIQHRQALLTYAQSPQKSLDYLRQQLGLQFNHQKELLGAKPNLPTRLDPKLITRETLSKLAYERHGLLEGFEDSALDWLAAVELNPDRRRHLLSRLQRPDHANLAKQVVDDLNYANSGGFGSLPIHGLLLTNQLDECLKLKPDLLHQTQFVTAYILKLHPSADVDWRNNDAELSAYLDRLAAFVSRLAPPFNSLKAHVLYQQLQFDRAHAKYDKERFQNYIKLPRQAPYINPKYLESNEHRRYPCDLNANFLPVTMLPIVGNDEPLIRNYLQQFFLTAPNTSAYESLLNDIYLKHIFAETKIVNGLGEPEQWASLLPPEMFRQLKERIDLDFAPENRRYFETAEPVSLELFIKNVPTLLVKVYEINTRNFYTRNLREVDTNINLDGLVANEEQTIKYDESPLRRVKRRFEFKSLSKPGVFVIDFIGNGQSSRVLVRKGRLHHLVRTSSAGHRFTILDEKNEIVKDGSVWLAGHEYQADDDGTIAIPFSTQPGPQPIVLRRGDLHLLAQFDHLAESYSLVAGLYVDRESLLTRKKAKLVVRPMLSLNGTPVSTRLLQDVRLTITSTDLDGVASTKDVPAFELYEDRDSYYDFLVPQRLSRINFALSAKVQNVSLNQKQELQVQETFALNEIDRTDKIEDLHLACREGVYRLELLGKSGEPKADRAIQLTLKHRDFREPVNVTLQSDARGRVELGTLNGIVTVMAQGPEGSAHSWPVLEDRHSYHRVVHGLAGEPLELPYLGGDAQKLTRADVSLLELRGATFVTDRFDALSLKDSVLSIGPLPAGDYDLLLKASGTRIALRLTAGIRRSGHALGSHRRLELRGERPLHIKQVEAANDAIKIRLGNPSKFSRVHIFATEFQPVFEPYPLLSRPIDPEPYAMFYYDAPTAYVAGRNIGDEYRYILDRRYMQKFPGNMLDRPSLLLNPWAVRGTETGDQTAAAGEDFAAKAQPPASDRSKAAADGLTQPTSNNDFSNLDFLAHASAVVLNAVPDEDGVVTIARDELGAHLELHIVAVDPLSSSYRRVTLKELGAREFLDLRLAKGLDPAQHFAQQKQVTILPQGREFVIDDITSARFELYDSLSKAFTLYTTLSKEQKLAEFSFVLNWHKLKPEEKQSLYSKHACHELAFFIWKKDPEFFRRVVQPYLPHKRDKTFLDLWLVQSELTDFVKPWSHERLNIVERILLGQRLEGERGASIRHVQDLLDLVPPDMERANQLFRTALQGSALEATDALGLQQALKLAEPQEAANWAGLAKRDPVAGKPAAAPGDRAVAALQATGDLTEGVAAGSAASDPRSASGAEERRAGSNRRRAMLGRVPATEKSVDANGEQQPLAQPALRYFDDAGIDDAARNKLRALYRKLDKTQEWAENNYDRLVIQQQTADLVAVNAFWRDYAAHEPATPFYPKSLAEASRNFTEIMFALALLDLPAEAAQHESKFDGVRMSLVPGSSAIVFHEEIKAARPIADPISILVSQNFFRAGDRYRHVNNEQVDKFVRDEFLVQVVYGCQVVVTNPTSSRQKLDLLLQIPVGAIPVANGQPTKSVHLDLQPYNTQTIEYSFYFPGPGKFPHYPVHISKNGEHVSAAEALTCNVVREPTTIDKDSWDYISQYGSNDELLDYLKRNNLHRVNLDRIAFRMADAKFFEAATTLLAAKHVYNHTLWSYALRHNAPAAAREFLQHCDDFIAQCGLYLDSPLVKIDPVVRKTYQHLEYKPLVNARTHALGRRRQILNDRLHAQYHQLLAYLACRARLDHDDLMAVTCYMLLQDRIEEAVGFLARVNVEQLSTRMQYDYFRAYLAMTTDDQNLARQIADKYADHPVDRWRNAFAAVAAQLNEIAGAKAQVVDADDRGQQQGNLAASESSFDFQVEARQIVLNYRNLDAVTINYYRMDIELLFSRNPFVQQQSGQFGFIKPNLTQSIQLPEKGQNVELPLPEQFQSSNVMVEITAGGQIKSQAYYAHSLALQLTENYGQLHVTHAQTGKPLPKTYVKVYAQMQDGRVRFYKDGYTDLRGRFDYASLNTNELDFVQKFSLLVLNDELGAVVREANPPKR
jgi:hypothetical protein